MPRSTKRPNLLLLIADQLTPSAVGAYGGPPDQTPHLDRLAASGVRFDNVYTAAPLCNPSRTAFWTGRYPHQTGITSNGQGSCPEQIPATMMTMGRMLTEAGYKATHFGKMLTTGALEGFEHQTCEPRIIDAPNGIVLNNDTFADLGTTDAVCQWLENPPSEPFITAVDLNNPHNICGWVGEHAGDSSASPANLPDQRPDLPPNFRVDDMAGRPLPIQYLCCSHRRQMQAAQWSDRMFQGYLAAYAWYTQLMDQCIGRILASLATSPVADQTIILFFSDHGDAVATRRMVTKHCAFYEPVTRVPLIISGPGVVDHGGAVEHELFSLLDLMPTIADLTGNTAPEGLPGLSLAPYLRGDRPTQKHEAVFSQWHTEYGHTIEPGRMMRTSGFKYTHYRENNGEELYDLGSDPNEMHNLAQNPDFQAALDTHREQFRRYCDEQNDPYFDLEPSHHPRWREHGPGFEEHRGPCSWDFPPGM